jgi:DNA polymerase III sliding clamp (beta) subunit (PCNA family)
MKTTIQTKQLQAALAIAKRDIPNRGQSHVHLVARNGTLEVLGQWASKTMAMFVDNPEFGEAENECPCVFDGDSDFVVGLNHRHLRHAVKSLDTDIVTIKMNRPDTALVVFTDGVVNHLVMPMRI